jgi:hypothetical protein
LDRIWDVIRTALVFREGLESIHLYNPLEYGKDAYLRIRIRGIGDPLSRAVVYPDGYPPEVPAL